MYCNNASAGDASIMQRMYGLLSSPSYFKYRGLKNCTPYQCLISFRSISLIATCVTFHQDLLSAEWPQSLSPLNILMFQQMIPYLPDADSNLMQVGFIFPAPVNHR